MKRFFLLYLLLCAVSFVYAQNYMPDCENVDLGYIVWKHPSSASFAIYNESDSQMRISRVEPGCSCVDVNWTKEAVKPGCRAEISVTYDAKLLGRFQRDVAVWFENCDNPLWLSFHGEVTANPENYSFTHPFEFGNIRLDRESVEFERVKPGESPYVEIGVANMSNADYQPVLMHLPPYLTVEAVPSVIKRKKTGRLIVTLHPERLPRLGLNKARVYLSRFLGDKVSGDNEIPVTAVCLPTQVDDMVNPPVVELSQNVIDAEDVGFNDKGKYKIVIRNNGGSPLEIKDLQVSGSATGVSLRRKTVAPGRKVKLSVEVYGDHIGRMKEKPRVIIITNDPVTPVCIINIKTRNER